VDLRIETNSEDTARLMNQGQAELQDQLLAAGLEPGSMLVQHEQ